MKILDCCCGSKMFWFQKDEPHTTFMDKRQEQFEIHGKKVNVKPDVQANINEVLNELPIKPLFGDQRGKTRWIVFGKVDER